MLTISGGKAVASMAAAVAICGVGVLIRRFRRGRMSPDILSRDIEDPLISPDTSEILTIEEIREFVMSRGHVELHCHLNGTVRRSTLNDLLDLPESSDHQVHTIEDAFREFKIVYQAVNTEASLRRIVRECLQDAVVDDVRYLELRTTPRQLSDVKTRREYVRIVLDEIDLFPQLNRSRPLSSFARGTIAVRVILTIDRAQLVSVAEQTVDIALRYSENVVGIDFAGNPNIGSFSDFLAVFHRAKGHGLFTTVHTSEIRGVEEETDAILAFKPNRIGHFLFPSEQQMQALLANGICIESCPTSNVCALSGRSPTELLINGHPVLERLIRHRENIVCVNTDDPGVFNVTLTDEIVAVARTFCLNKTEIDRLITAPAHHAFLSPAERSALATDILK